MPDLLDRVRELEALLARCNPPGYIVEPSHRAHDNVWVWDSCDDDWDGYGTAEDEEEARRLAWEHFRKAEAERARGDR